MHRAAGLADPTKAEIVRHGDTNPCPQRQYDR
jgi:hypothetical protein